MSELHALFLTRRFSTSCVAGGATIKRSIDCEIVSFSKSCQRVTDAEEHGNRTLGAEMFPRLASDHVKRNRRVTAFVTTRERRWSCCWQQVTAPTAGPEYLFWRKHDVASRGTCEWRQGFIPPEGAAKRIGRTAKSVDVAVGAPKRRFARYAALADGNWWKK
jgi:hypothetical protein